MPTHPDPKALLASVTKRFMEETGYRPVIGTELEFYLSGDLEDAFVREQLDKACKSAGLAITKAEKEEGKGQYEIALTPEKDPLTAASQCIALKRVIQGTAEKLNLRVDFNPKPDRNQPGSSMHVHIHLENEAGHNLFRKEDEETESKIMYYSIGGLCAAMPESMIFFAPDDESYHRFTYSYTDEEKMLQSHAPVNVSWGGNNRTTALRIPSHSHAPDTRRIEHRVPGINADPHPAIAAILSGIMYGIKNQAEPPEKTYGNAFDKQYNLPALPSNPQEAERLYREGSIIRKYMEM